MSARVPSACRLNVETKSRDGKIHVDTRFDDGIPQAKKKKKGVHVKKGRATLFCLDDIAGEFIKNFN